MTMGAWPEGRAAAHEGLALDPQGLLKGMPGVALLTWMEGRPQDALSQMAAYVDDARRRGDLQGLSFSLAGLAEMALQIDRPADAETAAREAYELLRAPGGWRSWPGLVCGPLAETVVRLATPDAETVLDSAEQMITTTEQYVARPQLLRARGLWLQQQGELDRALEALTLSAKVARSQQAHIQLGRTLDVLAALALQRGDAAVAAQAEAELKQLVDSIGPEVSMLAWARRVGMAADSKPDLPAPGRSVTGPLAMLTRREREVAVLMARGLTNRQIADELVIAEGTAGVHVDHILNKLGFRSRAQVAAWAVEQGLLATATN
jgi:non-specific serine/threonine protein kinase